MSAHTEPCVIALDFTDEVPRLVLCIPDEVVPGEAEAPSGLVFSESGNSGLLGAL